MWNGKTRAEELVREGIHGRYPYRYFKCNRNPITEDQRPSHMVQNIMHSLERRKEDIKEKKGETKPLPDEIEFTVYKALMERPAPRYTRHAHAEEARKKIVFTLLYYTGARANELRELTRTDLDNVLRKGQLELVSRNQRDAIVRVLPTVGHKAMRNLTREVNMLFKEEEYKTLGDSRRRPGRVMHEKAWINYINREIKNTTDSLQINNDLLSSHSFRVKFITRHLKNADSREVAQVVGHKSVATTLKYIKYAINQDRAREILDKGYQEQQS
jgi:integrase